MPTTKSQYTEMKSSSESPSGAMDWSCLSSFCEKKFQGLGQQLRDLSSATEHEFLGLGGNLNNFSRRSQDITAKTLLTASLMSGKEMEDLLHKHETVIKQSHEYLNQITVHLDKKIEALQNISGSMHKIQRSLDAMAKIPLVLRTLSIHLRVECAHFTQKKMGFQSVVGEIESLIHFFNTKLRVIGEDLDVSSKLIKQAHHKAAHFREKQHIETTNILEGIKIQFASLVKQSITSKKAIHAISRQSHEISSDIGKIVMALQAHDIARQKIEHVNLNINEARDLLEGNPSDEEKGSDQVESPCLGFLENAGTINSLCKLQILQLEDTQKVFVNSVCATIDNQRIIVRNITRMASIIQRLFVETGENESSLFQRIEDGTNEIALHLSEHKKVNAELSKLTASTGEIVAGMVLFTRVVEDIGFKGKLISLNAQVNAGRLGNKGVALSVISEGIQRIVMESDQQIKIFADYLEKVKSPTESLIRQSSTDSEQKAEVIWEGLQGMLSRLREMYNHLSMQLRKIDIETNSLVLDLNKVSDGITVHKTFERVVRGSISSLAEIVSLTRLIAPINTNLDALKTDYTMSSERRVHQSFLGSSGQEIVECPEGKLDLTNSLGDNVELF